MKSPLFIERFIFRAIGPIVTGSIVYLLILLLNNNIDQIFQSFISDEFFVCVGLSFITSELNILLLRQFRKFSEKFSPAVSVAITVIVTCLATALLVCVALTAFYSIALGFKPNWTELQPFLILYTALAVVYASIYFSNHFVQQGLAHQLEAEQRLGEEAEENFQRLTRGINPDLLFESLESLITLVHHDKDASDDLIDDLSIVYRYTLSNNQVELVSLKDELYALDAFVRLLNKLPYRTTEIINHSDDQWSIVPGTLLHIVEKIIKSTIVRKDQILTLTLDSDHDRLCVSYKAHDRLVASLDPASIQSLSTSYTIYTDQPISIHYADDIRTICIPTLTIQNERNEDTHHRR